MSIWPARPAPAPISWSRHLVAGQSVMSLLGGRGGRCRLLCGPVRPYRTAAAGEAPQAVSLRKLTTPGPEMSNTPTAVPTKLLLHTQQCCHFMVHSPTKTELHTKRAITVTRVQRNLLKTRDVDNMDKAILSSSDFGCQPHRPDARETYCSILKLAGMRTQYSTLRTRDRHARSANT